LALAFGTIPQLAKALKTIKRAIGCLVKVAVNVLSILVLLCISNYTAAQGQTQSLARILNVLSVADRLTGFEITALETNIIFDQNISVLEILQSNIRTNFSKSQIAALEEMSRNNTGIVTNICSYVYKFDNGAIYISREQFNTLGKLTQKDTIFVTATEVQEYHNPVKAIDGHGGNTGWAVIRNREGDALFGMPPYLSKSTLYNWIKSSSVQSCNTGKSLAGQDCYVITISAPPHVPIKRYKLFLQLETFLPVEFNGYLADGAIYSRTDLQFEKSAAVPVVCKRAAGQTFKNGKLWRQFVWVTGNTVDDTASLPKNAESFIPPQTQVLDQRFSKPLNYRMGVHPPTSAQIKLMLRSTTGVASYEAGINIRPGTRKISGEKRNWIRAIFIIIIITPLLIFLPKLLKKR
jgi:hypothetical protein